ncbi:hypothetical protein Dimus_012148 [Dionaea muscipula]
MVIPSPARPLRITEYLKPYVLKMHFTNKYVHAQVIHSPTATVAASASSQENALRPNMGITRDVAAAAKIGKILGERLLVKGIPAACVILKREHKYHGKVPEPERSGILSGLHSTAHQLISECDSLSRWIIPARCQLTYDLDHDGHL